MAIPVDEAPNISLDMKEFTDKTPVHYDEMNSRHKQHLDNEKALLYPAFDDSGNVSSISSFNDFLGTIKSRMRLFDFFRNFKTGMQFVMHLGRAANNCTTTSDGLYLDARQGKVLMDLYTKLNSDLSKMINTTEVTYDGINVEANSYQIIGRIPDGISHDKILSFSIVWVTYMQGISSIIVESNNNVYLYASGKISNPLSAVKIRFLYRK